MVAPLAAAAPIEAELPPEPPQGMELVQPPPAAEDDAALAAEDPLTGLLRMQVMFCLTRVCCVAWQSPGCFGCW